MQNIQTALVKYIYLDVVSFTHKKSVEAQSYIIEALNGIVRQAVSSKVEESEVIYIPVGDGICIALPSIKSYDDHISVSEDIVRRLVSIHNTSKEADRQFQVRIGINENFDNLITDINGNKNVCGSGVNDSQRIMSFADANQILVGRITYDTLTPRERYSKSFRRYVATTKHNVQLELYHYIGGNIVALNREIPTAFRKSSPTKLSKYAAYYIAHIIRNKVFIEQVYKEFPYKVYGLALLMGYLAEDSVGHSESGPISNYTNHMPETPNNTIQEQLERIDLIPYWVTIDAYDTKIETKILTAYDDCYIPNTCGLIVSESGIQKLKTDWPEIWSKFNLDKSND